MEVTAVATVDGRQRVPGNRRLSVSCGDRGVRQMGTMEESLEVRDVKVNGELAEDALRPDLKGVLADRQDLADAAAVREALKAERDVQAQAGLHYTLAQRLQAERAAPELVKKRATARRNSLPRPWRPA